MTHTEEKLLLLYFFTLLLQCSVGLLFRNSRYRNRYGGQLQGNDRTAVDMIMELNDHEVMKLKDRVKLRHGDVAVSSSSERSCFARSCLWPKSVDGHVYISYTLSLRYTEAERGVISRGMGLIERDTCVRFIPRTHQRDFLFIQPQTGCWSYLGVNGGRQILSLQSPECVNSGVVSHQLMHALGFLHEQSRSDRDQYVTIKWSNIWKDHVRNFEKFKMNNMDMPYDYGSVMHLGKYTHSEDGAPTVVPKQSWNVKLGQAFGPSELDVMKINHLYKCVS